MKLQEARRDDQREGAQSQADGLVWHLPIVHADVVDKRPVKASIVQQLGSVCLTRIYVYLAVIARYRFRRLYHLRV